MELGEAAQVWFSVVHHDVRSLVLNDIRNNMQGLLEMSNSRTGKKRRKQRYFTNNINTAELEAPPKDTDNSHGPESTVVV